MRIPKLCFINPDHCKGLEKLLYKNGKNHCEIKGRTTFKERYHSVMAICKNVVEKASESFATDILEIMIFALS